MMECKNALVATNGDLEAALEHLRKSGAAKAAKKAGRIAAEGAIALAEGPNAAALVEINSETDFAANEPNFGAFAEAVARTVLKARPADLAALARTVLDGGQETVEEARQNLVLKIGENISIRRFVVRAVDDQGIIGAYRHGKRIGVLVEAVGGTPQLAKDIAMHVAASSPVCVAESDIPPGLLEKEKEIRVAQAAGSGKPPEIIEKMVAGQLRKFIGEITLLGQPFVKDPERSVGKLLGNDVRVRSFIRYEVGDGIEKKEKGSTDHE